MKNKLLKATLWLTILTLVAKVIGLVREIVIASVFGVSISTDTFNVASGLVNNVLFALTTGVSAAFIPLYISNKVSNDENGDAKALTGRVAKILFFIGISISLLIILFARPIATVIAPFYSIELKLEVARYLRILAVAVAFFMLTQLFSSVLNAERKYGFVALIGIIYSITSIAMVVLFEQQIGVDVLAYSVLVAYILQFLLVGCRARRYSCVVKENPFSDTQSKRFLMNLLPIMIGNATIEVNQLVGRLLASDAQAGAVTSLTYANTLSALVITLIVNSILIVFFTELSEVYAQEKRKEFNAIIKKVTFVLAVVLVPITLISVVYAQDVVAAIYQRGAFTSEATHLTAQALVFYAAAFLPVSLGSFSTKAFYASGNTKLPMILSIFTVVLNIIVSIALYKIMGFPGIACGTLVAETISSFVRYYILNKKIGCGFSSQDAIETGKILLAGMISLFAIYMLKQYISTWNVYFRFGLATMCGCIVYSIMLVIQKSNYTKPLIEAILKQKTQ